ncbi:MAG: GNAT family protein [Cyanobacteria bacterium P01_H01_bin.152]
MSLLPPLLHQGRSLSIRRTAPQDAAFLYCHMYQNADFMQLFRLNDNYASEAQLSYRLAQRLKVSPAQSGNLEVILLHKRHGPIGVGVLADYSALHRRAELLIGIFDTSLRAISYGVEASLLLGDLAFNQYNFHRLYAYSYAHNIYSQKALESGGFQSEGRFKDHVFDQATQAFVDLKIFGMTEDQFRQNQRVARLAQRLVGRDITKLPAQSVNQVPHTSAKEISLHVSSGQRLLRSAKTAIVLPVL